MTPEDHMRMSMSAQDRELHLILNTVNRIDDRLNSLEDRVVEAISDSESQHTRIWTHITALESDMRDKPSFKQVLSWLVGAIILAEGIVLGILPLLLK